MDQIYMTLLIELAKAFLSIENAPNAHPQLKKALTAAMAESMKPPPPPPPVITPKQVNPTPPSITLKKDD